MAIKSLIINPGSTSTKVGVFEDETLLFEETLRHSTEEIAQYASIIDQKDFRKEIILNFLAATSCASLSLFRRIFSCQNSTFDRGILNLSHPGCPCQKHPFMNITVWYLLSTMSGHPGSLLECNEYLNPSECSHLRTTISGRVSFPLIRDMQ